MFMFTTDATSEERIVRVVEMSDSLKTEKERRKAVGENKSERRG